MGDRGSLVPIAISCFELSEVCTLHPGYQVALAEAAGVLARQAETSFVQPIQIAILYGIADEVDRAAIWIEKAYEVGDPNLPYLKHLPVYPSSVMSDPRVQEIVTRLNYP